MALPTSGPLSLNDIAGEFGGATPHSLSEYYGAAAGIPTSGTISISDFYGASAFTPFDLSLFNLTTPVNTYSLSSSYAPASMSIANNGTYLVIGDDVGFVDIFSTSTPYTFNSSTTSFAGRITLGRQYGAEFDSTGTLFFVNNRNGYLYIYSVSPAFSLNQSNYTLSQSYDLGLYLGNYTFERNQLDPSGTVVLSGTRSGFTYPLAQHNLSSSFSLSPAPTLGGILDTTSYYPAEPVGLLSGDGNRVHVWYSSFGSYASFVQFVLSTNKDISTGSYEYQHTFSYPIGRIPKDIAFNPSGDRFYYMASDPSTGYMTVTEFQP